MLTHHTTHPYYTVQYSGPVGRVNKPKQIAAQMRFEDNLVYTYQNVASCTHHLRQWNWLLESRVRITQINPLSNAGLIIPTVSRFAGNSDPSLLVQRTNLEVELPHTFL
jgi:hypothetical protein